VANGYGALASNYRGGANTANGYQALHSSRDNDQNTATGYQALYSTAGGGLNTATGSQALYTNTSGIFNTASGTVALYMNTIGSHNVADGMFALYNNTTGAYNAATGYQALYSNTIGSSNIAVGAGAGFGVTTASSVIAVGSFGANVSNSCFIGNIRGVTTQQNDAIPVVIASNGQLGTQSSSGRFKKEIKPMDKASEAILALKPVTFHYKSDNANRPEFGLIAEQVAEINADLVVRDNEGEIYTVRYDAVNAMLLNEFLKEHRKNEEQRATIAELKSTVAQQQKGFESQMAKQEKQIEALSAGLQKVSAQLELSKTAPQTVLNTQ
jgi:hypothetical protein